MPPTQGATKGTAYREGQPIPPGYVLDEGPVKGLIIAGAIVLGVPYVLGLTVASENDFEAEGAWLILPVAGPWVALGAQPECDSDASGTSSDCSDATIENVAYTMSGIVQATGAALFIAGLTSTRRRLLREDVADVNVTPMLVAGRYGLGAFGRFR